MYKSKRMHILTHACICLCIYIFACIYFSLYMPVCFSVWHQRTNSNGLYIHDSLYVLVLNKTERV